jgi:hypothetical protein
LIHTGIRDYIRYNEISKTFPVVMNDFSLNTEAAAPGPGAALGSPRLDRER